MDVSEVEMRLSLKYVIRFARCPNTRRMRSASAAVLAAFLCAWIATLGGTH